MDEVHTLLDRARAVEAPSIAPGRSPGSGEARLGGIHDVRISRLLRPLFQVLVHPWAIALANATIAGIVTRFFQRG